ncbi:hypothetical protein os1_43000 [Comamonadaceae bacterium OS-1]|nr:hypothetical protein os1_43000 [Comamonadaceae bacterium OS-1]
MQNTHIAFSVCLSRASRHSLCALYAEAHGAV